MIDILTPVTLYKPFVLEQEFAFRLAITVDPTRATITTLALDRDGIIVNPTRAAITGVTIVATKIVRIEARISEDVRQTIEIDDSVDVSDWTDWELVAYLYNSSGTAIVTCTVANGRLVKTGTGTFYFWFKSADLAISAGTYSYQVRRIDTGENTVLLEGPFALGRYAQP